MVESVHQFACIDPHSPESHLRSVLWDILGGMGAESVESAAQRVVRDRDVYKELSEALQRQLNERPAPVYYSIPNGTEIIVSGDGNGRFVHVKSPPDHAPAVVQSYVASCTRCGRWRGVYDGWCSECMSDHDL